MIAKTRLGLLLLTLAATLAVCGQLTAATLSSYSGYSEFGIPCDLCDSFVNFSVYQNTDGNWTDDAFFSGSNPTTLNDLGGNFSGVDAAANYVFMYQVIEMTGEIADMAERVGRRLELLLSH